MLVSTNNLSKTNGDKEILNNVSLTIENKDKIALIGVNGTGKSTLLKIIARNEDYLGKIVYQKDIQINYLPQTPVFDVNDRVIDAFKKTIDDKDINVYEIKAILNKFGIKDENQVIKELSGGQIKRVALAIVLINPCDLLILDEPTNHLDNSMIDYLENYLIRFSKALLMVTHDRYFLERVTNKIVEIDRLKLYEYDANYSKFLELKEQREAIDLATQHKRKNFLRKEIEWVRAGVQARTTKSKSRLENFEKLKSIQDIQEVKNVELISGSTRLGRKTIELRDISKSFGDKCLFTPFSYMFKRFDRIGIIGDNGTGKSTLLNMITGEQSCTSGSIEIGDTVRIGYFKQGYEDLPMNMKVIDYIKDTSDNLITDDGTLSAKNMCERFLFDAGLQHTQISRLSGGERRRLYLLKILMIMPNVLILDEPTNDLDIQTLQILEDYLDDFNGIVITVSHDRYFLDRVCDGLFVLKDQTLSYVNGGYSNNINSATTVVKNKTDGAKRYQEEKRNRPKMSYNDKKELASIEEVIATMEKEIQDIDYQMNESFDDYELIAKLTLRREELLQELEVKNERWLELLELEEQTKS